MTAPIAILSALAQESAHLTAAIEDLEKRPVAGGSVVTGPIDGHPVVLGRAGIGKVNTAILATAIFTRFTPDVMIFSGVAGGLDPGLGVGDVVVATRTLHHDAGVLEDGELVRYQAGHIPGFNPTDELGWTPSRSLLARVTDTLAEIELEPVAGRQPRISTGTIVTGDQYLQDGKMRDRLHDELGAAAVDMEGAALAQTATVLGTDHLVIRTLSDLAGETSIRDFNAYLSSAAGNSARVVRHILPVVQSNRP